MTALAHMRRLYYTAYTSQHNNSLKLYKHTSPYSAPLKPHHPFVEPSRLEKGKTALHGLILVADQLPL
jgi:hypothetical protein